VERIAGEFAARPAVMFWNPTTPPIEGQIEEVTGRKNITLDISHKPEKLSSMNFADSKPDHPHHAGKWSVADEMIEWHSLWTGNQIFASTLITKNTTPPEFSCVMRFGKKGVRISLFGVN
jgi:hypothetical protein